MPLNSSFLRYSADKKYEFDKMTVIFHSPSWILMQPEAMKWCGGKIILASLRYHNTVKTGVLKWHQSVLIEDHTLRC